jgi:hypothetical protein
MPLLGILYTYSGCRCNYTELAQATQARYARLTSLSLYVMYAQAVRSVRPVESTARQNFEDKWLYLVSASRARLGDVVYLRDEAGEIFSVGRVHRDRRLLYDQRHFVSTATKAAARFSHQSRCPRSLTFQRLQSLKLTVRCWS